MRHRVTLNSGERQDFPHVGFDKSGWLTCELDEPNDEGAIVVTLPPQKVERVETINEELVKV